MKKLLAVIILIIAIVLLWRFSSPVKQYIFGLHTGLENLASSTIPSDLESLGQKILAPPPLFGGGDNQNVTLTQAGVIAQTNLQRRQNGNLPPLAENSKLDQAASIKLNDLFKQQYFEHVNPQGKGPSDLANEVGYAYIAIGENLALGNFDGDTALVTAWMNSPGHRANILNTGYSDIGVGVGQGQYQGKTTWIAVQEFGRPASSCPSVDSNLKAEINSLQTEIDQLKSQLDQTKTQLDNSHPQTQSDYDAYNQQVAQYNAAIQIYNNKVDSLKLVGDQYNAQVKAYNACVAS